MSVIRKWHLERGWKDVGYHYFIKVDGTLQSGRPLENVPAAQRGYNTASIAICLHGLKSFTEAQFRTLKDLCQAINAAYGGEVTFHGHREVEPAKTCPVFDYRKVLGLDGKGKLRG